MARFHKFEIIYDGHSETVVVQAKNEDEATDKVFEYADTHLKVNEDDKDKIIIKPVPLMKVKENPKGDEMKKYLTKKNMLLLAIFSVAGYFAYNKFIAKKSGISIPTSQASAALTNAINSSNISGTPQMG